MRTEHLSAPPVFDPDAPFPELAAVRQAAVHGDWQTITAVFASCAEEYGLLVLADEIAVVPGVEHLLRQVLAHRPGDPLATVLLADHHIHAGWDARTSRAAEHVTAEGWRGFRAHLNQAEQLLIGAVARNRADTLAWTLRLTVCRGISLGLSENSRRYRALTLVSPHSYAGQRNRLQQLLPKWGGSWGEAHAFALESFRAAPPGSMSGALLAMYHVERLEGLDRNARAAHAARADVRAELAEAAHGSVLHPACHARFGRITAHSGFAMLASLGGDLVAARAHFLAMGPYGRTHPWDLLGGEPERYFQDHRSRALARG